MIKKRELGCIALGFLMGGIVGYVHGREPSSQASTLEKMALALPSLTYAVVGGHHVYRSDKRDITEKFFTICAGAGLGALASTIGYGVGYMAGRINT